MHLQACVVVLCASLCNGVVFSILNSFGVLFIHLKELYGDDPDSATKVSMLYDDAIVISYPTPNLQEVACVCIGSH